MLSSISGARSNRSFPPVIRVVETDRNLRADLAEILVDGSFTPALKVQSQLGLVGFASFKRPLSDSVLRALNSSTASHSGSPFIAHGFLRRTPKSASPGRLRPRLPSTGLWRRGCCARPDSNTQPDSIFASPDRPHDLARYHYLPRGEGFGVRLRAGVIFNSSIGAFMFQVERRRKTERNPGRNFERRVITLVRMSDRAPFSTRPLYGEALCSSLLERVRLCPFYSGNSRGSPAGSRRSRSEVLARFYTLCHTCPGLVLLPMLPSGGS
jgi:hypothetical protein